jgi:hypothetical protein
MLSGKSVYSYSFEVLTCQVQVAEVLPTQVLASGDLSAIRTATLHHGSQETSFPLNESHQSDQVNVVPKGMSFTEGLMGF